jgi:hypothetical protein
MKKKGLAYEQHQQAGAMLKRISADLTKLFVEVANAYPKQGDRAKATIALSRAQKYISLARSRLEDLAVLDCGPRFDIGIYYGARGLKGEKTA